MDGHIRRRHRTPARPEKTCLDSKIRNLGYDPLSGVSKTVVSGLLEKRLLASCWTWCDGINLDGAA